MRAYAPPITDSDLAKLRLKFQVPVIIARIMETKEYIDDYGEWDLRDAFGAMPPERALIALALCAEALGQRSVAVDAQGAKELYLEAERIIAEHGRAWLAQQSRGDDVVWGHVAEDLESLGDHLLAIQEHLDDAIPDWYLAWILGTEAHAQEETLLGPEHQDEGDDRAEAFGAVVPLFTKKS